MYRVYENPRKFAKWIADLKDAIQKESDPERLADMKSDLQELMDRERFAYDDESYGGY